MANPMLNSGPMLARGLAQARASEPTYAALRTALAAGTYQEGQAVFVEAANPEGYGFGTGWFQVRNAAGLTDDSLSTFVGGSYAALRHTGDAWAAYTNAISMLDAPGKHPAFSHTRATVGALCQQFDGSFYQPEIGEIGSHGMRRVRNLLANTDTLATQGVTVEAADYWLSFTGTGSVAVSGVATDSLVGTGVSDRVSKKITAGAAGTMTLTVTGSVTNAMLTKSRVGQSIADPEYVSRGVVSAEMLEPELWSGSADVVRTGWTQADDTFTAGASSSGQFVAVDVVSSGPDYLLDISVVRTAGTLQAKIANTTAASITATGDYQLIASGSTNRVQLTSLAFEGSVTINRIRKVNYHGWGIDGVRCFKVDEYGEPLTVGLGPERLTNGTFDSDLSGWDLFNTDASNTITAENGEFVMTGDGTTALYARYSGAFVTGRTYRVSGYASEITGVGVKIQAAGNEDIGAVTAAGAFSFDTVATGSNLSVYRRSPEAMSAKIDYISVREVYPVRAAGAVRNPAVTNLTAHSNDFSNTTRSYVNTTATAEAEPLFPGGAWKIASNNATGGYIRAITAPVAVTSGTDYTISFDIKADELDHALVIFSVAFASPLWTIDLAAGTVSLVSGGTATAESIEELPGGWYRVSLTDEANATTNMSALLYLSNDGVWANRNNAITLTEGVIVANAQVNTGAVVLPHVPTTTAAVAAAADIMSLDPTAWGYDQAGGTFVVVSKQFAASDNQQIVSAAGAAGESWSIGATHTVVDGGVTQASIADSWSAGDRVIHAVRIEANDIRVDADGANVGSDASATMPTITGLSLGGGAHSQAIEAVYYFPPGTVTDAQLLAMSNGDLPIIPELA